MSFDELWDQVQYIQDREGLPPNKTSIMNIIIIIWEKKGNEKKSKQKEY